MNRCLRVDKHRAYVDDATLAGLLLEEFIVSRRYVPEGATPVRALAQVSLALHRLAIQVQAPAQWRAWSVENRVWFVVGQIVDEEVGDPQAHAIRVMFYDIEGTLVACADWLRRSSRRWVLYKIFDPAKFLIATSERLCPKDQEAS